MTDHPGMSMIVRQIRFQNHMLVFFHESFADEFVPCPVLWVLNLIVVFSAEEFSRLFLISMQVARSHHHPHDPFSRISPKYILQP